MIYIQIMTKRFAQVKQCDCILLSHNPINLQRIRSITLLFLLLALSSVLPVLICHCVYWISSVLFLCLLITWIVTKKIVKLKTVSLNPSSLHWMSRYFAIDWNHTTWLYIPMHESLSGTSKLFVYKNTNHLCVRVCMRARFLATVFNIFQVPVFFCQVI